jgi:hypothetical protein
MMFLVTSDSSNDGDYPRSDFILSADCGFGCAGGNRSPHLKWLGAPAGTGRVDLVSKCGTIFARCSSLNK